jgi:hypothetical protein
MRVAMPIAKQINTLNPTDEVVMAGERHASLRPFPFGIVWNLSASGISRTIATI